MSRNYNVGDRFEGPDGELEIVEKPSTQATFDYYVNFLDVTLPDRVGMDEHELYAITKLN